jgi:hypothetical protein
VRLDHQSESSEADGPDDSAERVGESGPGNQMMWILDWGNQATGNSKKT